MYKHIYVRTINKEVGHEFAKEQSGGQIGEF